MDMKYVPLIIRVALEGVCVNQNISAFWFHGLGKTVLHDCHPGELMLDCTHGSERNGGGAAQSGKEIPAAELHKVRTFKS